MGDGGDWGDGDGFDSDYWDDDYYLRQNDPDYMSGGPGIPRRSRKGGCGCLCIIVIVIFLFFACNMSCEGMIGMFEFLGTWLFIPAIVYFIVYGRD